MKKKLFITVSGMVGTGKTTTVKHIAEVLRREGIDATQWRFQRLPCITLRPASHGRRDRPSPRPAHDGIPRGIGYRARDLTPGVAMGYLVRTVAFRLYRRFWSPADWAISNRYFYDSFAHFDLQAASSRYYADVLRRTVPKPDLALLMVASPQTLAARRPQYSHDYISRVEAGYRNLRTLFPDLIEINSEPDHRALERVESLVRERLAR